MGWKGVSPCKSSFCLRLPGPAWHPLSAEKPLRPLPVLSDRMCSVRKSCPCFHHPAMLLGNALLKHRGELSWVEPEEAGSGVGAGRTKWQEGLRMPEG